MFVDQYSSTILEIYYIYMYPIGRSFSGIARDGWNSPDTDCKYVVADGMAMIIPYLQAEWQ